MLYISEYCELLLLSLVWISVYDCNQTLHRFVCIKIGVDGVLIDGLYLGLLLLSVSFGTAIGGGSLHLHCIAPL